MEKFLTSSAIIYLHISQHPNNSGRLIASSCGFTERTVLEVINKLVKSEYLSIERIGRNNRYTILKDFESIINEEAGVVS